VSGRELDGRIRRLEREQRVWRGAALGGLVLLLGSWARSDEVVSAPRFELVDEAGRVRAELAVDAAGRAGLFVRDGEGRVRAELIHDAEETALYLRDGDGAIRVGAAQYAHGGGGFALHGEATRGAAVLYMKNRQGSLSFYDADGTVRARLPE